MTRDVEVTRCSEGECTTLRLRTLVEFILPRREVAFADHPDFGERDVPLDEVPGSPFVRIGLWDHAYTQLTDTAPRTGRAEADDFIGSDSFRFYIRVTDAFFHRDEAHAAGLPAGRTVTVEWSTRDDYDSDLDVRSGDGANITCVETSPGSGVFISSALMLVLEDDEAQLATDSGLDSPAGLRQHGESDHRLRRANMRAVTRAVYHRRRRYTATAHVFRRDPDERRTLHVRAFVFTSSTGSPVIEAESTSTLAERTGGIGLGGTVTTATRLPWPRDLSYVREVYERAGVQVVEDMAAEVRALPDGVQIDRVDEAGRRSALGVWDSGHERVIRLFFVERLHYEEDDAERDIWGITNPGPPNENVCCFLEAVRPAYTTAHEIGHVLVGGHHADGRNLMFAHSHTYASRHLETGPGGAMRFSAAQFDAMRRVGSTARDGTNLGEFLQPFSP